MAIEIISLAEARARGLKKYFTGEACKYGHIAERSVGSRTCRICQAENRITSEYRKNAAKYRSENYNRIKSLHKAWRDSNREHVSERGREWERNNPEKRVATVRKWRAKNRVKITDAARDRRRKNPERASAAVKRWISKNPDYRRVTRHRRRARTQNAEGRFTLAEIRDLYAKQCGKCTGCRVKLRGKYHADHIIPLSLGGSNWIENIQLLCQPCNSAKYNKHPIVWAQENGRLL